MSKIAITVVFPKPRNVMAMALTSGQYSARKIPSKKTYSRKKKQDHEQKEYSDSH